MLMIPASFRGCQCEQLYQEGHLQRHSYFHIVSAAPLCPTLKNVHFRNNVRSVIAIGGQQRLVLHCHWFARTTRADTPTCHAFLLVPARTSYPRTTSRHLSQDPVIRLSRSDVDEVLARATLPKDFVTDQPPAGGPA